MTTLDDIFVGNLVGFKLLIERQVGVYQSRNDEYLYYTSLNGENRRIPVRAITQVHTDGVTWAWGNSLAESLLEEAVLFSRRVTNASNAYQGDDIDACPGLHEYMRFRSFCIKHLDREFGPEARPGETWEQTIKEMALEPAPA